MLFSWYSIRKKSHANKHSYTLQGAATNCYLALHPTTANITGKYFADCNETAPLAKATDEALGKRLWEFSQELVNGGSKPT